MLTALESAIAAGDAEAVEDAVFALGRLRTSGGQIDDQIPIQILGILRRPEMRGSPLTGRLMNFFEFEATRLSQKVKDRCAAFLREWGSEFTDFHSIQVVGELLQGEYLKPIAPRPPRKKPRHAKK